MTVLTVVGYGTPTNKVISPTQSPVSCSPWVSQSEDLSDTLSTPASCCKELKANSYMKVPYLLLIRILISFVKH